MRLRRAALNFYLHTPRLAVYALMVTIAAVRSWAAAPVDEWLRQMQFASSLADSGDLGKAEALFRSALMQAESARENQRVAIVWQNLGNLLQLRGQALEAEKAYLRGVNILTRSGVEHNGLLVRISGALSTLYIQSDRESNAEAFDSQLTCKSPGGGGLGPSEPDGQLGSHTDTQGQI